MIYRKKITLTIKNGPSKLDLLLSLATCYAKSPNRPHRVEFTVDLDMTTGREIGQIPNGYVYRARIAAIGHEDGSGHSFNIDGFLSDNGNGKWATSVTHPFSGYYDATTRRGTIWFEMDLADDKPSTAAHSAP